MLARAMKNAGRLAIVLSLSLPAAACVQPVHKVARDESFMKPEAGRNAWRKVAVLPFTGEPAFRRVAAEWFAFRLHKHGFFEVVDPFFAEIELKKKGILFGEAAATVEEVRKAGELLGVDGVVSGSVDPVPVQRGVAIAPVVNAKLVDLATGKVVADSALSFPAWLLGRRQERMIDAVDRIAEDFAPLFYAAAGKPWTPPPKTELDGQEPQASDPALR